jgi:hypothetical protein
MNNDRNNSLTLLSPQRRWQARFFLCVSFVAGVFLFWDSVFVTLFGVSRLLIVIGAALVGVVSLVGALLSSRCPGCGHSLLPYEGKERGLPSVLDAEVCPKCGYSRYESDVGPDHA